MVKTKGLHGDLIHAVLFCVGDVTFFALARHDAARCALAFILSRPRKNEPRKRTKGPNAPWNSAELVSFAIFWWLPKGVLASAKFASAEPKLRLLLRASYLFSLHAAPRFKANQEKDICFLSISPDGTHHARRGAAKARTFANRCVRVSFTRARKS